MRGSAEGSVDPTGVVGLKTVRHAGGEKKRVRKVGPAVQGSLFTGNICSTERFGVRQTVKKRNRAEWMLFPVSDEVAFLLGEDRGKK